MNEAINDGSRLVAKALQTVRDYRELEDPDCEALLAVVVELLEEALDKLATNIGQK